MPLSAAFGIFCRFDRVVQSFFLMPVISVSYDDCIAIHQSFLECQTNLDGAMLLTPIQEAMLYDQAQVHALKGNIRKEDLVTQGTRGYDELRREKDSLEEFAVGNGPYGGMSIGESPVVPVAAAIAT